MTQDTTISLWDASAEEADPNVSGASTGAPAVDGLVDVAVVGGGFTGLSTALHCAQKGLSVRLLEAKKIGYGGSGRNVGLVNAGLWLPPRDLLRTLGDTYGPRFLERFGRGPATVFDLIEKHQIRCEVTRTGTIHAADGPKGLEDLKARHAEWVRLGEPVDLLDRAAVAEMVGTDRFHGGLLDHRCGTINPMGYCRGLARAAVAAGAAISTGTRVRKLRRDAELWKVETDHGMVAAKSVVLGTNAYTDTLWPDLNRVFTMIHYFQIATPPLGPEAAHILPGRQGLWDTGKIMFNVRRDAKDRLLLGSMGKVIGTPARGLTQRWARKQIARLFPGLGPVTFEEAWHGQIAMTPDHLPRIYELAPNLFAAIGYNGRGITTGTIFGQTLADLVAGTGRDALPLPISDLSTVRSAPVMQRMYQTAFTANQFLKAI